MDTATWQSRRRRLREEVPEGTIFLPGHTESPRNYPDNPYPFRQDSTFLYFTGLRQPDLALVLLPDGGEVLVADPPDPDAVVWTGPRPGPADLAAAAGVDRAVPWRDLPGLLERGGAMVHTLPPYRDGTRLLLAGLLGMAAETVADAASPDLIRAVVAQREVKSAAEVAEIERALACSALVYRTAFRVVRPGITERRLAGMLQGVALLEGMPQAFPPIVTVHGEILHGEPGETPLAAGRLLLVDTGVETDTGYCSDITRTLPVSGVYSPRQRDLYQAVLAAQETAVSLARPGITNRELHLAAARTLAAGLHDLGLLRGDVEAAVAAGAHALFFPHGLGHLLGMDVHDMENLGDVVGYAPGEQRSRQFGLNYLRLARELRPGFVLTVEPGCYFIPALIDRWQREGRHAEFIDYAAVARFRDIGGLRIEDDILITERGCRVLGPPIPKTAEDIELLMQQDREAPAGR